MIHLSYDIKQRVEALLSQMTLEEKIAQLFQTDPVSFFRSSNSNIEVSTPVTGPEHERILNKEILYNLGSILSSTDADTAYKIQKEYLENNRLQIPLLFMFDIIHGFRTIFPIPLGLACSWDPNLVEETAKVAAKEGAASGINVTFAPMADLVRDARWGRVMESPGEDPLLNSMITSAYVKGFQGDDLRSLDTLVACIKHFAAYGAAEGGREYNTVDMSESTLRNYYLPAYKAAIDAGVEMVMTAFNIYDGVPATGNKFLLRNILKEEWSFDGVVISDYASVAEIAVHTAAKDGAEAAQKAIQAGLDIEMISTEYISHLKRLVAEGEVEQKLIDDAVRRILTLKFKLGLFDDPFRYIHVEREKKTHLKTEYRALARTAAAKSMVLLKNDGILPLSKQIPSIAVIGPFADSGKILGGWSALGKEEEAITLKQGIINKLGEHVQVTAVTGCDWNTNNDSNFCQAIAAAKEAEMVILALGEHHDMSGEGGSRAYLNVPGLQQKLADEVLKLGKPTVLVLFNGRPLELKWFHDHVPAILEAWYPGTEGGNAIADVLFGDVNPSAKLTMSFPYTVGQVPIYYNCLNTGRPKGDEQNENRFTSRYIDIPNAPFYPFGYGLSYTTFAYANATISQNILIPGESITVTVDVSNTGGYTGQETVQLYIRDLWGSVARPMVELKDFQKVSLTPGDTKTVEFRINTEQLTYFTADKEYKAEPGDFKVFVGTNSMELLDCGTFTYRT